MNISTLIQGFSAYLEELNQASEGKYNTQAPDVSIFMYSQEFKKYLNEELGDGENIASMSLTDLISMDVVNGKLVSKEDDEITLQESSEDTLTVNNKEKDVSIDEILNDLFSDSSVQQIIDTNKDGDLNKEELNIFLNTIKGFDEQEDDISINDVIVAAQAIQDGTFKLNEEITQEEISVDEPTSPETVESTGSDVSAPSGTSGPSGTYSPTNNNGDYQYNTSSPAPASKGEKVDSNSSLQELQDAKDAKTNEITAAQTSKNDVYSGTNANVKKAIEEAAKNEKTAKEAYDKLINDDDNIEDELKEKRDLNLENISNKEKKISDKQIEINNKEVEITKKESEISDIDLGIKALDSAISSLEGQKKPESEEGAKEYNKKIEEQIILASEKKEQLQTKLEIEQGNLNALRGDKEKLEENLTELKDELIQLEIEKSEIEQEILNTYEEGSKERTAIQEAMNAYNTAREEGKQHIEEVKQQELAAIDETIEMKKAELAEINSLIETKKTDEAKSKYSVLSLDNPQQLFKEMGLEEQGLNYDVFALALEGYNKLEDKGNGLLGIFDTTQDRDAERYYLLDLNTFQLVERSVMKIGSGDMDSVAGANNEGSHATTSGFKIVVGEEYYSSSMGKRAIRYQGLEDGINDNDYSRSTVAHYTTNQTTWGCMGFTPVLNGNGSIDIAATNEKMRRLFPTGTIIFTMPTDLAEYRDLSELV